MKFSTYLLRVADEFVPFIPVQVALGLDILSQLCAGAVEPDFDIVDADSENICNFSVFHSLEFAADLLKHHLRQILRIVLACHAAQVVENPRAELIMNFLEIN